MNESGKKAYEIAYALWRMGNNAENKVLAEGFFGKAVALILASSEEDGGKMIAIGNGIESVIKFAVDTNCISIGNAAILMREIGNLKTAISKTYAQPIAANETGKFVSIADIFSQKEEEENIAVTDVAAENTAMAGEIGNKSENRQSAIIEKIRQNGTCRLADIQEMLPEVSDRTLRYDLESLIQRNIIERFGPGGRAVYYRLRVLES